MAGDDEQVAAHALAACGCEPIGAAALDQFDELILVRGQALPEHLLFVGGIDGDRADRALAGMTVGALTQREQSDDEAKARLANS